MQHLYISTRSSRAYVLLQYFLYFVYVICTYLPFFNFFLYCTICTNFPWPLYLNYTRKCYLTCVACELDYKYHVLRSLVVVTFSTVSTNKNVVVVVVGDFLLKRKLPFLSLSVSVFVFVFVLILISCLFLFIYLSILFFIFCIFVSEFGLLR